MRANARRTAAGRVAMTGAAAIWLAAGAPAGALPPIPHCR